MRIGRQRTEDRERVIANSKLQAPNFNPESFRGKLQDPGSEKAVVSGGFTFPPKALGLHVSRITHHASRLRPSPFALRPSQGGIALIIVMISIFVLAIMAMGFAVSMRTETALAANANNEAELEWLGRSGVEYCRWILAEQQRIPQEP